ncbi:hypothetical protein HDU76_009390, partial [Blyttiomyces sp. JEL0837]
MITEFFLFAVDGKRYNGTSINQNQDNTTTIIQNRIKILSILYTTCTNRITTSILKSALLSSCINGCIEIMKWILQTSSSSLSINPYIVEDEVIYNAVNSGNITIIKLLMIYSDVCYNGLMSIPDQILQNAIESNHVGLIELALSYGANIDFFNPDNNNKFWFQCAVSSITRNGIMINNNGVGVDTSVVRPLILAGVCFIIRSLKERVEWIVYAVKCGNLDALIGLIDGFEFEFGNFEGTGELEVLLKKLGRERERVKELCVFAARSGNLQVLKFFHMTVFNDCFVQFQNRSEIVKAGLDGGHLKVVD